MKLRVQNRQVVKAVAKTTYKANMKRNLLTVFAIILTTFMITFVLSVGVSYWNTISERQLRMEGMEYDIELTEPRKDQVETICSMDGVTYAGVFVKCGMLLQYQDKMLDGAKLYWMDETCWNKQTIPALEKYQGNYPKKENEIMLAMHTLKAMGIQKPEPGMVLPVTYITLDEDIQDEDVDAQDIGGIEKEFVLSGWYSDYSGKSRGYVSKAFYETTGVEQTDFTCGFLKITLENHLYSEKDLISMGDKIDIGSNQMILANEDVISNFCKMVAVLTGMLLMIFISGYLFIYNTMYISISKDIRYYGQLKTIGMTSVQLKRVVYSQIGANSLIGIPAGLLAAAFITKSSIAKILALVNPELDTYDVVSAKVWIYVLAGGFALVTNMISCKKPAQMAGDCSPIEALRYTKTTSGKKSKKSGSVSLYSMALQNIFRDRKQAVIIFLSFITGLSVFLVVNVFIRENDARYILNETMPYDIQFKNQTTLEKEKPLFVQDKISRVEQIPGVESVGRVSSAYAMIPYQENVFGEYYRELYKTRYTPGNYEEDIETYKENPKDSFLSETGFIGIDEEGFAYLNEKLGNVIDKEAFMNGEVAVASKMFTEGDNHMTGKTVHFSLPQGLYPDREYEIVITAVDATGMYNPAHFARGWSPDLIVSESYVKELMGEPYIELINVKYKETFSKETEKKVKEVFADEKKITYDSKLENYSEMRKSETQAKVLGYSIGAIVALLALLNYLNMMAAGILNRAREFATLESIGMTTRQMKKTLRIEGVTYGVLSIIGSLPIGIPLSYIVFKNTNQYYISYSVPWINNLLLFAVILVLCTFVPVILYKRIHNGSIIEQLRSGKE